MPPAFAFGVPARTPVAGVKVTVPAGSVPVTDSAGVGTPVAVTVNVPGAPAVNVVVLALVIAAPVFTVSVKLWVAGAPMPLVAVMVIGKLPELAGLPVSTPLGLSVTP